VVAKLKIAHLLSSCKWTGVAEPVVTLSKTLGESGHDVTLFCASDPRGNLEKRAQGEGVMVDTSLKLSRRVSPLEIVRDLATLATTLQKARYQIVHTHLSHDHWIGALAARLSKSDIKVVRTVHNLRGTEKHWPQRFLFEKLTDRFITVSEAHKTLLSHHYRLSSREIEVVRGAVDLEKFHPSRDGMAIRKELGISARDPIIGIVARFQMRRGHRFLLEATGALKKQIAGLKVLLVGKGEFRPHLEQMVRDLNLQETVIFTGYRDDDLPEMYALFDVNVFLREGNDGSCRALLEAMATGKPVVAFGVGAIPEIVRHGMTGYLVPPDEVKALTESLSLLLSNKDRAVQMGKEGRRVIEQCFTRELQARRVEEIYKNVVLNQTPHLKGTEISLNVNDRQ